MDIGSKSFWTREYQHQIAKMVGICYRYVSVRETAEDLAHDAFLKAIEKADSFRGIGSFDKWLMRITVNTALEYLRANPQTKLTQDIDDVEVVSDEYEEECSPEDMMSTIRKADFTQEEIMEAIAQLPDHHRVVLNLYVFERLSHKEIAKMLNISQNTSKSHLMRARKELQIILFNKSKRKKRTFMVLFPLFTAPECAIDAYCRKQLSGFAIVPRHPLTETGFPSAINKPLSLRMKLRAWRVPLIAGATTITASVLLVPFLLSPKESAMPSLPNPTPVPIPTAIDSSTMYHNDYQEEEKEKLQQEIPNPITRDSIPRPKPRRQAETPINTSAIQTNADTNTQAPKNVVVKKVTRKKHQTVVIEN